MICPAPFLFAQHLSPLAHEPDWSDLEKFQQTISHDEFVRLLNDVYAPGDAAKQFIEIGADSAGIVTTTGTDRFILRFANGAEKSPPRFWKPASGLKKSHKPLDGVNIALDPGHLGGRWAKMEERWFQFGADTKPVAEGDMTLRVAKLLAPKLLALGADVSFVRRTTSPATTLRPVDMRDAAIAELQREGVTLTREDYAGSSDPLKFNSITWQSELLFYRTAEIRKRARIVNRALQPDLVLCLHFNAEAWGDEKNPTFVDRNHMHVLVNGCYAASELALDDIRHDMLVKLLTRCYDTELPASESVANFLAGATGLPPYEYTRANARHVGDNPYVWARNLLANRLYRCPVVYIEPYVMNSKPVWERVQLGDYEGEKMVGGEWRKSIYREYADAVADGLAAYYKSTRGTFEKVPK